MRKDEVEFHVEGYAGPMVPAVNVKVYWSQWDKWPMAAFEDYGDPGFTPEWIREHLSEQDWEDYWSFALETGWEDLQSDAESIFGEHVKVYGEGRSGGWAVVHGLPKFETWDVIDLNRWTRFAKRARATADDTPYRFVTLVAINAYDHWASERERLESVVDKWASLAS